MQHTLHEIDPLLLKSHGPWLFPNPRPTGGLELSLRTRGQLHPLLATEEAHGPMLIDGARRAACLAALGRKALVHFIRAPRDLDKGLVFLAANDFHLLGDQAPPRFLLPVLRFFEPRLDEQELERILPPALGLDPRSRLWTRLRQWTAVFRECAPFEEHVRAGHLDLSCIETLSRMDEADRDALEPFFRALSWSAGASRQLVTLLHETAQGRRRSVGQLIAESGLDAILDQELSPRDAMARILDAVRNLRYPQRSRLERNFTRLATELSAGTPWRMEPDPQFETEALTVSARLRSPEEARKAAARLLEMAESPLWRSLSGLGDPDAP